MNKNFNNINKIEKVIEENPLIILLESKIIIKNEKQRIEFYLSQISNVRVIKKRNLALNGILLIITGMFYLSKITSKIETNISTLVSIFLTLILFTISCSFKSYNYKLLINKGIIGFSEIAISEKNIQHAESFARKFKKDKCHKLK